MVEICCGSFEDAVSAYENGADRIELNSALYLGGLTPSIGTVRMTKQHCPIPVICMVRSRGAGFYYSIREYDVMKEDGRALLDEGVDGIAFGFLQEDGTIDEERTREFVELIHEYGKEAVFHRAVDCLTNIESGIEQLITFGVDRILTSGGKSTALEGQEMIRELQEQYGARIQILPGSGINARNVVDFMKRTGVRQIHSSCRDWKVDPTTETEQVSFSYEKDGYRGNYEFVNGALVSELVQAVRRK